MADSPYKRPKPPTIVKHPLAPTVIKDGKLSAKSAPKRRQPTTPGLG
jgi:hypothetical protein